MQFCKASWICAAVLLWAGGIGSGTMNVFAQIGTTSAIQGVVRDSSGAALPGASVTATDIGTGRTQSVTADQAGRYRINSLPVGQYDLKAALSGFDAQVQKGMPLTVDKIAEVDFTLNVGQITQEVT